MLELLIIVGIVVWMLASDSLLMLPALAVAGGLLAILAIWDDVAARRAVHNVPAARRRCPVARGETPEANPRNQRAA